MGEMTYSEALSYIHQVSWRGSRLGLDRTRELMRRMGDPQKHLRFIHVAGTNGKGSTAAMLSAILTCAGYRTGLYTSPFINRFNERMAVDGEQISDAELAEITEEIRPIADAMDDHPTEFELVTAIGFAYFARHGCDVVVLEVGMGGELDSTNVIDTPELAVITNIGFDHVRELGPTLHDIARAKAGIIKPGGTVVIYGQNAEADEAFIDVCARRNAELIFTDHKKISGVTADLDRLTFDFGDRKRLQTGLIGEYQAHNAAVVLTAVETLRGKGWNIPEAAVREGLLKTRWPARFEILCRKPLFVADGAHNPQGVEAAVRSLQLHFPSQKIVFLLGVMADKDVTHMLERIKLLAEAVVTVAPNNPRAMPAEALAERLTALGLPATACDSVEDGVLLAVRRAGDDGVVCALGSLYMQGDVRACMERYGKDNGGTN